MLLYYTVVVFTVEHHEALSGAILFLRAEA